MAHTFTEISQAAAEQLLELSDEAVSSPEGREQWVAVYERHCYTVVDALTRRQLVRIADSFKKLASKTNPNKNNNGKGS
jgi:hypothetical protein